MKIGLSAEWIGTRAGGPEVYSSNLIHALSMIDHENQYSVYLSEKGPLKDYSGKGPNVIPRLMWGKSRWVVLPFSQPLEMMLHPVDLFHATSVAPPFCPAPFVLTVTELGFERHPEFFPRMMNLRLSKLSSWGARRAKRILSISEYTKNDLVEIYKIDPEKIIVTYCGVSERFRPLRDRSKIERVLEKYGIPSEYILYVGKLEARKNVARLLRAYHQLRQETRCPHKLVLVGNRSYLYSDIFETVDDLALQEDVWVLENIPRGELPAFYNGASLFVFPSLLEAFGLPPVEAMACGIPVVVSNTTSLPEIAGDAAFLVDPYSVPSIAEGMQEVLMDEKLRESLVEKGFRRANEFTWKKTAERTLEVYRTVYHEVNHR